MRKISVWAKYHFILYGGGLFTFILAAVLLNITKPWVAIVFFILAFLSTRILARGVKCPRCKKSIDGSLFFFSIPREGFPLRLKKKCWNCGLDLKKTY
jgi:hypothetical protein